MLSGGAHQGQALAHTHSRTELPCFVALGALCGVLGAGFVYVHRRLLLLFRRWQTPAGGEPGAEDAARAPKGRAAGGRWHAAARRWALPLLVALATALLSFPDVMGDFMALDDHRLVEGPPIHFRF